jgi:hypothetical protein
MYGKRPWRLARARRAANPSRGGVTLRPNGLSFHCDGVPTATAAANLDAKLLWPLAYQPSDLLGADPLHDAHCPPLVIAVARPAPAAANRSRGWLRDHHDVPGSAQ